MLRVVLMLNWVTCSKLRYVFYVFWWLAYRSMLIQATGKNIKSWSNLSTAEEKNGITCSISNCTCLCFSIFSSGTLGVFSEKFIKCLECLFRFTLKDIEKVLILGNVCKSCKNKITTISILKSKLYNNSSWAAEEGHSTI